MRDGLPGLRGRGIQEQKARDDFSKEVVPKSYFEGQLRKIIGNKEENWLKSQEKHSARNINMVQTQRYFPGALSPINRAWLIKFKRQARW